RALVVAGAVAALLVAAAPFLASTLHVSTTLPVVLALATPTAALLAIERGRCYGTAAHGVLVASFGAEPAVRLTLGLVLAAAFGATGAAFGVVLAGYAALAVATRTSRTTSSTVDGVVR